jgi:hypothetical protein
VVDGGGGNGNAAGAWGEGKSKNGASVSTELKSRAPCCCRSWAATTRGAEAPDGEAAWRRPCSSCSETVAGAATQRCTVLAAAEQRGPVEEAPLGGTGATVARTALVAT